MIAEAPITHVETLLAQAMSAYRTGDVTEAETLYGQVLQHDPANPHALHLLGLIAHRRGDLEMAASLIGRAATLHPHSRVQHNLGVVLSEMLEHDAALVTFRQAVKLEPDYTEAWANLIFALDLHPHLSPDVLKEARAAFDAACCAKLTEAAAPHENDRDPDRKLRVGYVGGDFRRHSAEMSFHNVILGHDAKAVEVALYSTAETHDATSEAYKERADLWCEVADVPADELAQIIREDQIDILVDLAGFSKGNRLLTFARKPAPIQISGWGYSSGTGIAAIDYLLADDVTVPPEHEDRYRSKALRLPSLFSYAPGDYPFFANAPEDRNGYRVYGYLGRAMKLNGPTLAVWAEILRRDPQGRLLLKGAQFEQRVVRDKVGRMLYALGVEPERVEVRGGSSRFDHLLAYNDVDVALDPFPQGGGMTVCDAALMGVPTATLTGEMIQGRQTTSLLKTLGHQQWASESVEEYVEAARGNRSPRESLRGALLDSIICDPQDYPKAVEAAYREVWKAWCAR